MPAPQLVPGSPPVVVQREPAAHLNNDQATAATIAAMCRLIHGAAADPYFAQCARAVPRRWCLSPAITGALAVAAGDWAFTKHFLKFQQDAMLCQVLAGEGDALEGLFDPRLLIRAKQPAGDCDDYTMFLCALLGVQGIPWEIVTVAADGREPGRWSHVYPRAVVNGRRLTLDASHGEAPGWEVPAYDVQRVQVWGPDGQPVNAPARGDVGVSHLHGYVKTDAGRYWRGFGRVGLGDDPVDTGVVDQGPVLGGNTPGAATVIGFESNGTPIYEGQTFLSTGEPIGTGATSGGGVFPAGGGGGGANPLAVLASQAIAAGGQIGKEALLQPGQTLLPNGQVVSTGMVPSTFGSSISAALGGMSGTTIAIGVGLLFLVVAFSGGHRR